MWVSAEARGRHQIHSSPFGLQVILSHLVWLLETKLESSARVASTLDLETISVVPRTGFLSLKCGQILTPFEDRALKAGG